MATLRLLLRALLTSAFLAMSAYAADGKKSYDVPATTAERALKRFSEISGRETLFAAEIVRGVRTTAVKGEFTPQEALDRILQGTGLVAVQDEKTGAMAVKRDSGPNGSRAAPTIESGVRPDTSGKVEKGVLVIEAVQVTGSRIRGLLAGATAQPVLTISNADI